MERAKKFFVKRLRNLLESKDMSQTELSKRLNINDSSISRYLRGERLPKYEVLKQIAEIFDVSTSSLLSNEVQVETQTNYYKIPILNEVRAGNPTLINEGNVVEWENLSNDYKKYGELFGLKVKGDSMFPKMEEDDILIIQRTPDIESGAVGIVLVNGDEATVKKVLKSNLGITLIPFNSNYEPISYSNDEIISLPVQIVGKVIEIRRKL